MQVLGRTLYGQTEGEGEGEGEADGVKETKTVDDGVGTAGGSQSFCQNDSRGVAASGANSKISFQRLQTVSVAE